MKKYAATYLLPVLMFISVLALCACGGSATPKPKAYFRIDLPKKGYQNYESKNCPYTFQYPLYARIEADQSSVSEPCWINVDFPKFRAKIHLSYKEIDHNLHTYTEESRAFAYKHTVKANAINEKLINTGNHVHGLLYEIGGNAASSIQFYLTDSTKHFMRGALYFYAEPNADSIAPVLDFINKDVTVFINSLQFHGNGAGVSGGKRK